eukprot:jgi/Orpsp1_1/1179550/evm.model.c7180000069828.1
MYSPRYSYYLINLKDWLPKEHLELYSSGIASQTCVYKNKWVGLPFTTEYSVLYYNNELLKKYNKSVPKTWNELYETGKYIRENEKDDDLIIYNGLFPDYESSLLSFRELIYSYRKTKDSPFPSYTSKEAIDALNMIKKIKNELASDEIFKYREDELLMSVFIKKFLFIKFWYFPIDDTIYKKKILVGNKEGVSASAIGGNNIGICNSLPKERTEAAVEVLKYLTSKEFQKELIRKNISVTGINDLYDDEEICKILDCELIKSVQPIARPVSLYTSYDEYSFKVQKFLGEFLYGNRTASEVLNDIENLTKIYYIPFISSFTGL